MKRPAIWIACALVVGFFFAYLVGGQRGPSDASSFSKGSSGWSAVREYVETLDMETDTLDAPVSDELGAGDVLVIAGSAAQGFSAEEMESLDRFVSKGGGVILGYGARPGRRSTGSAFLGVDFEKSTVVDFSYNPFTWRREAFKERRYATPGADPIALFAVREYPRSEEGDQVLIRNEKQEPVVILRKRGAGEIVLVPDEVFSNGRLNAPGNGALLESVRSQLGDERPWIFDEYHHGIVRPTSEIGLKSRRALDLFGLQILLAYLLFVLAIGRRFGPEWPEPAAQSGATSAFLLTIASMHDRLGHHAPAATVLRQRAKDVLGLEISSPGRAAGKDVLIETTNQLNQRQKEGRVA